ncbi:DUF6777 domain-containing protein [Streptomyces sp. NPDC005263]|uniref:DUF6777 domain-containing protein n=1 Tax=Streptomyces sp. NPDC005263 TaxID=3364711 RepID=UPI0036922B80
MVKAVAAGVPSLAPFFDEDSGLGQDAQVRSLPAHGGLQQGDTPGLYGGSKQPTVCDVERLEQFLTDPANEQKSRVWARVLGIPREEIPDYLERLTPVLLRHDTLVKNHDYKEGKAVPYDSLLQAGISILVDQRGLPAVKCSCGNPLRPFQGDTSRISVRFEDGNRKWRGYEPSSVVAVRPASRTLDRVALVDVHTPTRGINRPVGTTGEDDSAFDTRERRAVPDLAGTTFGQASRRLADTGLAAGYDGRGLPRDTARVTATDPPAGTELRFGEYVTLSVAGGGSGGGRGDPAEEPSVGGSEGTSGGLPGGLPRVPPGVPPGGTTTPPSSGEPQTPSPGTPGTPGTSGTSGPPGASLGPPSPPSAPPPGSGPPSSDPPPAPASEPAASPRSGAPPASVPPVPSPPELTSGPPPGAPPPSSTPVTTSAPPPTSATGEPAGGEPTSTRSPGTS